MILLNPKKHDREYPDERSREIMLKTIEFFENKGIKTCGASAFKIIFKLSKGLLIQILVVLGLATPISFFYTKGYLSIFPFHFEPGIFFYLFGGTIGSLILILTVSWQTWRAANRNPVEALRYE